MVAVFKGAINGHSWIDRQDGVGGRILEGNGQGSGMVGQGGAIDWIVFEDVGRGLDARPGGAIDSELPQWAGTLLVGEGQANVAGEHGAAQVDIEEPIFEFVSRVGLPEGRGIAIDGVCGCRASTAGLPDSACHFAAFLGGMGEEMGVADGVHFLAVFGQAQHALCIHLYQPGRHGPALPFFCAVEAQHFGPAGNGRQSEPSCEGNEEAHFSRRCPADAAGVR